EDLSLPYVEADFVHCDEVTEALGKVREDDREIGSCVFYVHYQGLSRLSTDTNTSSREGSTCRMPRTSIPSCFSVSSATLCPSSGSAVTRCTRSPNRPTEASGMRCLRRWAVVRGLLVRTSRIVPCISPRRRSGRSQARSLPLWMRPTRWQR